MANEYDNDAYGEAIKKRQFGSENLPIAQIAPREAARPLTEQQLLDKRISSIYGSEANNRASGVESYMSGLRENLGKNVASADYYNQQVGRERGIAKAKAGLSGVDTSAADEQSRRNAIYGAAGINEAAKRDALQSYGKGVGNVITGVNKMEQQAEANRLASLGTPVPESNSGFLDFLFSGFGV